MIKRFSFLAVAAVLALALSAPAHAATIYVMTDAGGGSADVIGSSTGATISTDSYTNTNITSINTLSVNFPLTMTLTLTGSGTSITGIGSKTIGTTVIAFTIADGFAIGSHLNLDGVITSVTNPTEETGYNFATLAGGLISISFDKTGADFAAIVGHGGSVLAAGLGVQESAVVPEPTSMALLGIGMTGFLAFRRFFKRPAVS
jgi:hypothetical protein